MRGFTIYFAVLISSLSLAVGLAVYDLFSRELTLSQMATQSEYAIYAADTGIDCALYWDSKAPVLNGAPSVFGTSTTSSWGGSAPCNDTDIVTIPWDTSLKGANYATTSFKITVSSTGACADVRVGKFGDPPQTTIESRGYNTTCPGTASGVFRVERTLQVSY